MNEFSKWKIGMMVVVLMGMVPGLAGAVDVTEESLGAAVSEPKPWEVGVSQEVQDQARALFREGTVLLNEASFALAAAKLTEALALWGHPAIHFNMAMAQVQMDRPLEARKHLLAAMSFGVEPIGEEKYETARTYQKLVEKQLARALIQTEQAGAQVSLDGEPLFTSPEKFEDFVLAGPHAVVAKKEGYLSSELSETFTPGALTELNIKLFTAEELTEYRRRWKSWMPWTVFGAGIVVAAVGGALHGIGISRVQDFDDRAAMNGWRGIETTQGDRSLRSEGLDLQRGAVGLYTAGGAAIAAGITLLLLNRPKAYLFGKPVEETKEGSLATPSALNVVPLIGSDAAGVSATLDF